MTTPLSKNFTLEEFACHCGCGLEKQPAVREQVQKLVDNIYQPLRDDLQVPIHMNSGVRCPAYNKEIGGAGDSFHKRGQAGDCTVHGFTPQQVLARAVSLAKKGKIKLGGRKAYDTFCHFDTGPVRTW